MVHFLSGTFALQLSVAHHEQLYGLAEMHTTPMSRMSFHHMVRSVASVSTIANQLLGGYSKFVSQGWNNNWLPLWIQDAGYNTYYTGKLFNDHTVDNWNSPKPSGWTGSDFLLDPHTYEYLNATFQRNNQPPVSYEGQYSTDILAEKAYGFLEQGLASDKPFFLVAAPVAPHSNVALGPLDPEDPNVLEKVRMIPPIPADRHKDFFPGAKVPRKANFNPTKASKTFHDIST